MEIRLKGIQAEAKKNFQTFKTLRPSGAVTLVHDSENVYDPYCIQVIYETDDNLVLLGYVPALKQGGKYIGSELQRYIIDNKVTVGLVTRYGYIDGDTFNDEHKGHLQSVTIEVDIPDNDSGRAIGGKYLRVTSFIRYFDSYGGGDGLIRWAFEQSNTYEGYKKALNDTAEAGTDMHTAIESYLAGDRSEEILAGLPEGWDAFEKKYEIDVIDMEQRFYDNTLLVTGQPDLFCYLRKRGSDDPFKLTVVDWKSSKKPSQKHKIQVSIYSKNKSFDGQQTEQAMIVAFGAENKQRFSASIVSRDKIETTYSGMKMLRQLIDSCGSYIPEDKYWQG